jgi:hypothetical protein
MIVRIIFLIIFLPVFSLAQIDSSIGKWIKIRSMGNNSTMDEWIRETTKQIHEGPLYIHDTIYVDSLKIGLLNKSLALIAKYSIQQSKLEYIQWDTNGFAHLWVSTKITHKKKKVKKTLDEYGGDAKAYRSQCPLDTVRGILVYHDNQHKMEDSYEEGMWVGCYPHYISTGKQVLLVPKPLFTYTDEYGNKHTEGGFTGRFYNERNEKVPHWRVYALITKFNYNGSIQFTLTNGNITNYLNSIK